MKKRILINKSKSSHYGFATFHYAGQPPDDFYSCDLNEWDLYELKYKLVHEHNAPESIVDRLLELQRKICDQEHAEDMAGASL